MRNNFYIRYKYLSLLKFWYNYLCLYKIRCLGFYKFIKIYINNFDIFDSRHFGTRHFCTLGVLVLDILVPILNFLAKLFVCDAVNFISPSLLWLLRVKLLHYPPAGTRKPNWKLEFCPSSSRWRLGQGSVSPNVYRLSREFVDSDYWFQLFNCFSILC